MRWCTCALVSARCARARFLVEQHMAHDILKNSVEKQTGRASLLILGILVGGVLVINSYFAQWIFSDYTFEEGGKSYNRYSAALA